MARFLLVAIALMLLVEIADSQPADAAIVYRWCSRGRINEVGAPSCGFSSYSQCQAAQGGYGVCTENPFYIGPTRGRSADAGRR
ncbi:MAG: DUF3551 domain-containing protein [Xanthobacteraceae bacterium]